MNLREFGKKKEWVLLKYFEAIIIINIMVIMIIIMIIFWKLNNSNKFYHLRVFLKLHFFCRKLMDKEGNVIILATWNTVSMPYPMLSKLVIPKLGPIQYFLHT